MGKINNANFRALVISTDAKWQARVLYKRALRESGSA